MKKPRVIHVIGIPNEWAIQKRAEALVKAMEAHVDGEIICYRDATAERMNTFDFIHVHGLQILPLLRNRLPKVTRPWGFEVISERSLKHLSDTVDLMKAASYCWCKNPRLVDVMKSYVMRNPRYVPNGVDTDLFRPRPVRVGWVGNKRDGKHLKYKGVPLIEAAIALLNSEGGRYVFLPDPSEYPKVLPQSEIAAYYHTIDVLVCASEAEGCSNVVMEALASSILVVSTLVGIAPELERAGLVQGAERSVEGIAGALVQAAGHGLRQADRMRAYRWDSVAVAGRYLTDYREALSEEGK